MEEKKTAKVPEEMRMTFSQTDWRLLEGIVLPRLLEFDDRQRKIFSRTIFEDRETTEKLKEKLEKLPKRSKSGEKANISRMHNRMVECIKDPKTWPKLADVLEPDIFPEGLLTGKGDLSKELRTKLAVGILNDWKRGNVKRIEKKTPEKMRMKLTGHEWVCLERALCIAKHMNKHLGWFEDNEERLENVLKRVLLLPRRSVGGERALASRMDEDIEIPQLDDYRGKEYHGGPLWHDLEELKDE